VAAEIVHDDDVAGAERGHEALLDPGEEAGAVDRTIEHAGCLDAIVAQCGQERHRLPVGVRHLRLQPVAAAAPAAQGRHVRLRPGLVDKDETAGLEAVLMPPPAGAPTRDVRPIPARWRERFF
jgi:hypothetical protein